MKGINLHFAQDLTEALELLQEFENSRVLAGGTDLLVDIKQGLIQSRHLISLQEIKELKKIEKKNGCIRLGAMSTPLEISSHMLIKQHIPALAHDGKNEYHDHGVSDVRRNRPGQGMECD